jgi:ABC-type oligopeptide transport system substrate-binding subunit
MRKTTRGITLAAGAAAVALALTACGGGSGSSSAGGAYGAGVVSDYWGTPQNALTPGNTNEVNGSKVIDSILTGLVSYDPKTNKAINENAASITTTDQQNFTVKLKPGWKFTDGTPVTAHSYVDAWNYAALSTNKQLNSAYFATVKGFDKVNPTSGSPTAKTMSGLKVVNDDEFTVSLTAKNSTWPQQLGFLAYDPLPQSFFKDPAAWSKNPVGDGVYKVSGSYTPGSNLKLVPNTAYSGTQKGQNNGVELVVYTDPNSAYSDLQSNKLDLLDNNIPETDRANMNSDLGGRVVNTPAGYISEIAFPLYNGQWGTAKAAKLRQGLSMAIDRNSIAKTILHDTVTPAKDFTSPALGTAGGYDSSILGQYGTYNPTEAKKLIQEAGGLPGGKMTITYNSDGPNATWVSAVCNSINTVLGNNTACVGKPVTTFASLRNQITDKQMTSAFRSSWSMDYPLAEDFLQPLFASDGSANDAHYNNPQFDKLIAEGNAASSPAQANKYFQQAEQLLVRDMPAIPLWYTNATAGYSKNVSGVQMDGFSNPVLWAVKK